MEPAVLLPFCRRVVRQRRAQSHMTAEELEVWHRQIDRLPALLDRLRCRAALLRL